MFCRSMLVLFVAPLKHIGLIPILIVFVLFPLPIVLSVLLRFTDYDYHFGIFKLFLQLRQVLSYWDA
jgi:hypothetical protein